MSAAFDVLLVEIRTTWKPAAPADAPPAFAVLRRLQEAIDLPQAQEQAQRFNTLRLARGESDPWAVVREHVPEFAQTADELLSDAEALLLAGFHVAAAVVARSALETSIKKFWQESTKRCRGFRDRLELLRKHGFIDRTETKRLLWMVGIGRKAARNSPVTVDEAADMVGQVMLFVKGGAA